MKPSDNLRDGVRDGVAWKRSAVLVALTMVACGGAADNGSDAGPGSTEAGGMDAVGADDSSSVDTGVADDSAVITDGGISPGQTLCGQTTCNAATQVCCVTGQGSSCTAVNACNGNPIVCSAASSCGAGDVCCAMLGGRRDGGMGITTSCKPSCGFGSVELCSSSADCMNGEQCQPLGMTGYQACVPMRPPPFDGGRRDGGPRFDAAPPSDAGPG
jgi:hypothetical protein